MVEYILIGWGGMQRGQRIRTVLARVTARDSKGNPLRAYVVRWKHGGWYRPYKSDVYFDTIYHRFERCPTPSEVRRIKLAKVPIA